MRAEYTRWKGPPDVCSTMPSSPLVVKLFKRISALDRKLLRDVWEMKGQSLAIAAVTGTGDGA